MSERDAERFPTKWHRFAVSPDSNRSGNAREAPTRDSAALALIFVAGITAVLALGVALSGFASEVAPGVFGTAGFGRDGEIVAEQRRQASAMAQIETSLLRVREAVASMISGNRTRRRDGQDDAKAGTDSITLAGLRKSLDQNEERTRHAFNAVNKRIDWLETLVYNQDVTGSLPGATPLRHGLSGSGRAVAAAVAEWVVLYAQDDVAVVAGKTGAIDVTPGYVIPDLGRVIAIRQENGHWTVVTEKTTIRER